jgi:hypothetical protein
MDRAENTEVNRPPPPRGDASVQYAGRSATKSTPPSPPRCSATPSEALRTAGRLRTQLQERKNRCTRRREGRCGPGADEPRLPAAAPMWRQGGSVSRAIGPGSPPSTTPPRPDTRRESVAATSAVRIEQRAAPRGYQRVAMRANMYGVGGCERGRRAGRPPTSSSFSVLGVARPTQPCRHEVHTTRTRGFRVSGARRGKVAGNNAPCTFFKRRGVGFPPAAAYNRCRWGRPHVCGAPTPIGCRPDGWEWRLRREDGTRIHTGPEKTCGEVHH